MRTAMERAAEIFGGPVLPGDWHAPLRDAIAAALEAAARDATEAAAAVCEARAEVAAAHAARLLERYGDCDVARTAQKHAASMREAAAAVRAGGTGGEHGQR